MKAVVDFTRGTYGSFIAWCIYSFSSLNTKEKITLPVDIETGNAHYYQMHPGVEFVQTAHHGFSKEHLYDHYILLNYDKNKTINYLNNSYEKFYKKDLKAFLHHHFQSFDDQEQLPSWQTRELLSMKLFSCADFLHSDQLAKREKLTKTPYIIDEPEKFILNIQQELPKLYNVIGLEENSKFSEVKHLVDYYIHLQKFWNRSAELNAFVLGIINDENRSLDFTTILDEAYIQAELKKQGIKLKCYNLNVFPLNTKDFGSILYK